MESLSLLPPPPLCLICHETMTMPVHIKQTIKKCECRLDLCLFCVRDSFGLNTETRSELSHSGHFNCPICRNAFELNDNDVKIAFRKASDIYTKDYREAKRLDDVYGDILCHRECGGKRFFRSDLDEHSRICKKIKRLCRTCRQIFEGMSLEEHLETTCVSVLIECDCCQKMIPRSYKPNHVFNCRDCNVPMCVKIFGKDGVHTESCRYGYTDCKQCEIRIRKDLYRSEHLKKCPGCEKEMCSTIYLDKEKHPCAFFIKDAEISQRAIYLAELEISGMHTKITELRELLKKETQKVAMVIDICRRK